MLLSPQWNEAETRYDAIDPLLKKAKWNSMHNIEFTFGAPFINSEIGAVEKLFESEESKGIIDTINKLIGNEV